MRNSSKL